MVPEGSITFKIYAQRDKHNMWFYIVEEVMQDSMLLYISFVKLITYLICSLINKVAGFYLCFPYICYEYLFFVVGNILPIFNYIIIFDLKPKYCGFIVFVSKYAITIIIVLREKGWTTFIEKVDILFVIVYFF